MKHTVPHDLGKDQARKVAEAAWNSYSQRFAEYRPTCNWSGPYSADIGFSAKGLSLRGSLEVGERGIDLDLDVPFLLRPFKGKAMGVIEEEIKKWIAKSKAGEI
jgi:hypothetical protein